MASVDPQPPSPMEPIVSVIIPVAGEEESLGQTLATVQSKIVRCEILVVNAGSSDANASVAAAAGARVVESQRRQRAHQLNLGAQHARGAALLFLHADTLLPRNALDSMLRALDDARVAGGAFTRRYMTPSIFLRLTCQLTRCRNALIGWHLGDQAMFVRRSVFFQLGGFQEVDQFEDLDLSRRLRRFGRTVTLRATVVSSARRFERRGAARTTLQDLLLTVRYLARGLPKTELTIGMPAAPPYERPQRIGSL